MGWTIGGLGLESWQGQEFSFLILSRLALGSTQPPMQWVPWDLSQKVKRWGHEAEHSPPTSEEDKKTSIYTYTLLRLHGVVLS
jgi:hypothetical protein